jgi:aerobic-type carbon monoxide dehydrogenase small subunit (CoxS/CutS family)
VAITTIEGIATGDTVHAMQQAFIAHDAVQCGYCTPGQLLSAVALLARDPNPDDEAIRRAMSGNLCRCGTYPKIAQAIRSLARPAREDAATAESASDA